MRRLRILLLALLGACREAPAPFAPDNPFGSDSGQLTFNLRGDHTPTWNKNSDSVYYVAESFPGMPITRGLLLAVPRTGGIADPLIKPVQLGVSRQPWLSAPALSADGSQIAFFELTDVRDREFDRVICPFPPMGTQIDTIGTSSILQEAVLRVRNVNSAQADDASRLTVRFAGRVGDNVNGITNVAHPFQRLFEAEGVPIFRASWSPDGTQLAYSDGSRIQVWTIGRPTSAALAGTDDGILPAWSPDGSLIAFSKPFRGTTQRVTCFGQMDNQSLPAATFTRTIYTPLTRENAQLMVIRPDGSGLRSLGIGEGPAWTADSRTIIAHRDRSLFRIAVETGAADRIANTINAFEPAVARDGRFISFARRKEVGIGEGEPNSKGIYNIWVAVF